MQEPTGMTFMSVLDVVENKDEIITPEETQLLYKCELEIEEGNMQHNFITNGKQGVNNKKVNSANVANAYSIQREALVQFGRHDWDDAIWKAIEEGKG